jgi:hypothetical protein
MVVSSCHLKAHASCTRESVHYTVRVMRNDDTRHESDVAPCPPQAHGLGRDWVNSLWRPFKLIRRLPAGRGTGAGSGIFSQVDVGRKSTLGRGKSLSKGPEVEVLRKCLSSSRELKAK